MLPLENMVLDGELVLLNKNGEADFSGLQNYEEQKTLKLIYYIFDILYFGGEDLRNKPLIFRRKVIETISSYLESSHILVSETLEFKENLLEVACQKRWEGLIAKKKNSSYYSKRHSSWLKIKCINREEYIVIGFSRGDGSRSFFGSLLLAEKVNDGLVYRGRVGTGFNENELKNLYHKFEPYFQNNPPQVENLINSDTLTWIQPLFYVEVGFTEKTKNNLLRHPVFYGLREDKKYKMYQEKDFSQIKMSNKEKVLYEKLHITKEDLWRYYEKIMPWFLSSNSGHPLTIVRCPNGNSKNCFFQKHFSQDTKYPKTIKVQEKEKQSIYGYLQEPDDVRSLIQLGTLEFHTWNSQIDNLDVPLYIVIDLDPDKELSFSQVIKSAFEIKELLEKFNKKSFVRTSGGKGLHVLCSIVGMSWEEAKEFSHLIAQRMEAHSPDQYISQSSIAKRKGKVFVDYLRNSKGATSIANYSCRKHSGAPVATPLYWKELNDELDPKDFNIDSIPKRLEELSEDPWKDFWIEINS